MEFLGKKIDGGLIFLLIMVLATLVIGIGSYAIGMISQGTGMIATQQNQINAYQYSIYDNELVSGDTVITAIKNAEIPNPVKLSINVETKDGGDADYGYDDESDTTYSGYNVTDPADKDFINPTGSFKGELVKKNGVVVGVNFDQQ